MAAAQYSAQPGSLSGERRQITALFYDIVGSTELLHRLDPEDFGGMQRLLHQDAVAAIKRHGGYLDRVQGDGGCAYFGLPEPIEDAAESGVACALEMIEACSRPGPSFVPFLKLRIGVATGLVVVADTRDSTLPGQTEIIGITPALASRIQSEAQPNSVVVADATYRLTRGAFVFEPMGDHRLKGFADPIRLWRPTERRSHVDRFSASRRAAAPLIGRETELDLCHRRWQDALKGKGQMVVLQGEAGLGKSRLIAEVRRKLVERDALIFQCQPRGNRRPLHPFLDQLRQAVAAHDPALPTVDRNAIRRYFDTHGFVMTESSAELLDFLLGSSSDEKIGGPWPPGASAEEVRGHALNVVLDLIVDWSRRGSGLVVIEDMHWADTLTQAAVVRLCERIATLPILVMVTSRENFTTDILRYANVLPIALSRLDESATSQLLNSIWEASPPDKLAAFIHMKSDGIPLFAEELSHLLKERWPGKSSPKDWEALLRDGNIVNLQDLVAARLAGLGPLRRVAQMASVIGREFGLDLLAQMIESETLPVTLDAAIHELVRARILRPSAIGPSYRFSHVLIQEAAYDNLLKSDRRELQSKIVRLVQAGTVSPIPDEQFAWHCSEAGQPLESARYSIQAAETCVARSAAQEADHLLGFAEEQLAKSTGGAAKLADLRLRLLTVRGPVSAALYGRGSERTRAIYEEGVALSASRTEEDRSKWFPLYWGWWFTAPDYKTQRVRSDVLLRDLGSAGDPEVRLQSLHCAWATNIGAGLHGRCLHSVEEGLKLYDEDRARRSRGRYGGHDAKICGLGERAFSLWFMGDDAASTETLAQMMQWAEHIDHLESTVHAVDYAVGLHHYRRDYDGVISMADRMAELGTKHGLPGAIAKAKIFRGWALAMAGNLDTGPSEFNQGYALQREIGTEENVSMHGGMRAEILERLGRHPEALAVLDITIGQSLQSGQVFWLAELYRMRARLRHAVGQSTQEVEGDLQQAFTIALEQEATVLAERVRADMKRDWSPRSELSP